MDSCPQSSTKITASTVQQAVTSSKVHISLWSGANILIYFGSRSYMEMCFHVTSLLIYRRCFVYFSLFVTMDYIKPTICILKQCSVQALDVSLTKHHFKQIRSLKHQLLIKPHNLTHTYTNYLNITEHKCIMIQIKSGQNNVMHFLP